MAKALIYLDKYSDWLEASNIFNYDNQLTKAEVHFIDNDRNDGISIRAAFSQYINAKMKINYVEHTKKIDFLYSVSDYIKTLKHGDYFIAPFVRYRVFWKYINNIPKGVITIHLSEPFPDSFGHIGYRLGYRLNNMKPIRRVLDLCLLPFWKFYAITHKADLCFYPFNGAIKNPFVKLTYPSAKPILAHCKVEFLTKILGNKKRTLLIGGFGFDIQNMAKFYKLEEYIATSKNKEIFVDGKRYILKEFICAEEVLLSGSIHTIIGYNSTVMIWAKMYFPDIKIICYQSSELEKTFGLLYSHYSKRALKKIGIEILPEHEELLAR